MIGVSTPEFTAAPGKSDNRGSPAMANDSQRPNWDVSCAKRLLR